MADPELNFLSVRRFKPDHSCNDVHERQGDGMAGSVPTSHFPERGCARSVSRSRWGEATDEPLGLDLVAKVARTLATPGTCCGWSATQPRSNCKMVATTPRRQRVTATPRRTIFSHSLIPVATKHCCHIKRRGRRFYPHPPSSILHPRVGFAITPHAGHLMAQAPGLERREQAAQFHQHGAYFLLIVR